MAAAPATKKPKKNTATEEPPLVLTAYRKFCGEVLRAGYNMKAAGEFWKKSALRRPKPVIPFVRECVCVFGVAQISQCIASVRRALVEDMSEGERKRRKFTLDPQRCLTDPRGLAIICK